MELLVVLAVIAIMTALTVPAISSLINAAGVTQAVGQLSLTLKQADTYAMAHNTYVWVGFAQNSTAQTVTVGAFAGNTGQSDDIATPGDYSPIMKYQTYNFLSLKKDMSITGQTLPAAFEALSSSFSPITQTIAGQQVSFTSFIQFNPSGEASINSTSSFASSPQGEPDHWIQIGLQQVRGGDANNPNTAVVQVATLTGQVQIYRP